MLDVTLLYLVLMSHLLQCLSFVKLFDGHLKVFQPEYETCNIVQRSTGRCFAEYNLDSLCSRDVFVVVDGALGSTRSHFLSMVAALSHVVHRKTINSLLVSLLIDSFPDCFNTLFIVEALKDSIATDKEEIKVRLQLENANLRVAHYHIRISSVSDSLRFDVTERA